MVSIVTAVGHIASGSGHVTHDFNLTLTPCAPEEVEAKRGEVTCPVAHGRLAVELDGDLCGPEDKLLLPFRVPPWSFSLSSSRLGAPFILH